MSTGTTTEQTSAVAHGPLARSLADAAEVAASRQRVRAPLLGRERTVTLVLAGGFVVAATGCALLVPSSTPLSIPILLLALATYVLASQVEFEVGPGSSVPTELVLVPMLFLLPAGLVPWVVATGLLLGGLLERVRSRRHAQRVPVLLCSAWHSVGPAVVIGVLAGGSPTWTDVPVYLLALVAQFGCDSASVLVRHRLGRGTPVRELAPALGHVVLVDLALAPIGFLVALAAVGNAAALLCVVPLIGLLHRLGSERTRRFDETIVLGQAVEGALREARSDPLTGVGNRLAWQEALAAVGDRTDGGGLTVMLVDLNELKRTNDTHGHDAGDRLIQTLASVLRAAVPDASVIARIGGDEFALLLSTADGQRCEEIVSDLRERIEKLVSVGLPIAASLGMASCPPCRTVEEAIRLADERLYAEKFG